MVYDTYNYSITIVNGVYKPSNIPGGGHIVGNIPAPWFAFGVTHKP